MTEFDDNSDVIGNIIFTAWGKEQTCASFSLLQIICFGTWKVCVSFALFGCYILKLLNFYFVSGDITIVSQYVTILKLLFLLLQY